MLVGGIMLATVVLVGSEDQKGALVHATSSVEDAADVAEPEDAFRADSRAEQSTQPIDDEVEDVSWAEDDDLVDDTSGFDPTPEEFDPADGDEYYLEDEL